jgi:hypothetical protein
MDIEKLAKDMLATKRGIGMVPPFYAETGSSKGNLDWPHWIVRNKTCNSLGCFMARPMAEALAAAMNGLTAPSPAPAHRPEVD